MDCTQTWLLKHSKNPNPSFKEEMMCMFDASHSNTSHVL